MLYGYARASLQGPTIEEQENQLKRAGCSHIFRETDERKRQQLALALHAAAFGDILIVTSLDRIARGVNDLLYICRKAAENGAGIVSLAETFTDPATEEGRYFPRFVEWCAAFDSVTRYERLSEGRARAIRENRIKIGKPSKLSPEQWADVSKAHENGETCEKIAERYGLSTSTISRYIARHRKASINVALN